MPLLLLLSVFSHIFYSIHLLHRNNSMTRLRLTLKEKYCSAVQLRDRILDNYNGDRNFVMMEGTRYKRTKEASLKQIYNDYIKLHKVEKIINDFEGTIDFDDDEQHGEEMNAAPHVPPPQD